MVNVFRKRILDKFARQVPELEDALRKAKMKLEPTLQPPFDMLVRSVIFQQLAYKAAKTIHDRFFAFVETFGSGLNKFFILKILV